jgi:ribosomal protein S27E
VSDKQLTSLMDFNEARRNWPSAGATGPQPNGIACPKCGAEMLDTTPGLRLLSSPPQMNVHCPACGEEVVVPGAAPQVLEAIQADEERPRPARLGTDRRTGLPQLEAAPRGPRLTSAQVRELLADFP